MRKDLVFWSILICSWNVVWSQSPKYQLTTGIPPSLRPPDAPTTTNPFLRTGTTLFPPATTTLAYLYDYHLLVVNCSSKCDLKEADRAKIEKELMDEIKKKFKLTPKEIRVEVDGDDLVVINFLAKHPNTLSKDNFRKLLNAKNVSLNVASLTDNKNKDFPLQNVYSKEGLEDCKSDRDRCGKKDCQYKDFASKGCFCSLYQPCDASFNRQLLWLLVIPGVFLLVLLILLVYCCTKNRETIFNSTSKKEVYINSYNQVDPEAKLDNSEKQESTSGHSDGESAEGKSELGNVMSNPTFDEIENNF